MLLRISSLRNITLESSKLVLFRHFNFMSQTNKIMSVIKGSYILKHEKVVKVRYHKIENTKK